MKTRASWLLEEAGPIVGILPSAEFSNTVVPLERGDILTLFTDGVTEQENEQGEQFSMDRLRRAVLSNEGEPASAAVTGIADAVSAYAGTTEQADDLTVVVVKGCKSGGSPYTLGELEESETARQWLPGRCVFACFRTGT